MRVAGRGGSQRGLRWIVVPFLGLWLAVAAGPSHAEDADSGQPFRVQLKWLPQAQFMGFYVALARGFYEREGLDVQFLAGGPGIQPADAIADGRADAVIEWMATALDARRSGVPLVNVTQLFADSGLMLVCRRDRGVFQPEDLRGRSILVWLGGNQIPVLAWLESHEGRGSRLSTEVELVEQREGVGGYFDGTADCISAMTYNEYWQLLDRGADAAGMTVFRFEDLGFALLEDGIYVDERRLDDPVFRDRLVRFLRASLEGWRYASEHPVEAAHIVTGMHPGSDLQHQTRMAQEIAELVGERETLGLLDLGAYDRTMALLAQAEGKDTLSSGEEFWTHDVWQEAVGEPFSLFSRETRYRLAAVLASPWFYALDLIGTLAFGIAGFMRATERRYDLWGALVLTMLPAVGGGTLRDLLVGGDRHPPFIFNDPTYIYLVIGIVVVGSLVSNFVRLPRSLSRQFDRVLFATDTIGLAAFTIIGASVAIRAELDWFWIPICSAITCAGGGALLDVVTGREPRTFRGEPYEEIAIMGGLLLIATLHIASAVPFVGDFIVGSICLTMLFVFAMRYLVVLHGWRMPLLGRRATARL